MSESPSEEFRRAKAGDRKALNRLLQRNQDRLTALARKRLGAGLKAKINTSDLLQSTYLEVLAGIPSFEGQDDESFVLWVGRIIENNAKDKVRFYDAKKRAEERKRSSEDEVGRLEDPVDRRTPSLIAAFSEDMLLVDEALSALTAEYRSIIELKVIRGLSHDQVASELGISETASRSLLARARAALLLEIERLRRRKKSDGEGSQDS